MSTNDLQDVQYEAQEAITAWLGTASSQIFLMQLGFLCYEVGFVKPVWTSSIILKNIEDTFVGILTYLTFTHTLATSSPSLGGIISVPKNIFLIGIDPSTHDEIFIAAVFATTCATIISGAVLERMKNKAYIFWCFLVILINYSFVSHWIWNPDGWLAQLGYMDGAGAVVVHSTGGVAGAIAVWRLGPRRGAIDKNGILKPIEPAARPIINAMGAFILWYGWFAFNISSPIAAHLGIGDAVGTTALVTCIAPTCASCSALLLMYWGFATLSYDNLLGAMLAGLVGITGSCFTVNVWEAAAIGFFSSIVYFASAWFTRYKLGLDDPLQIIPIHLCCGLYSCLVEGIFANDTMNAPGLVYSGYKHFGVQIFGTLIVFLFNVIICIISWYLLMEKCAFRNTSIRVSILDTYLGVSLFELNNTMALEEILSCKTNLARQMAHQFHKYTVERFNNEQFDFLIAINIFRDWIHHINCDKIRIGTSIVKIIDTYIQMDAVMCVNVSGTQRSQLIKIRDQLQIDLKRLVKQNEINSDNKNIIINTNEIIDKHNAQKHLSLHNRRSSCLMNADLMSDKVFIAAYDEVFKIILPVFSQFLQKFDKKRDTIKDCVGLPFALHSDWLLEWDEKLVKSHNTQIVLNSLSKAAKNKHQKTDSLLPNNVSNSVFMNSRTTLMTQSQQLELVNPEIKNGHENDKYVNVTSISPGDLDTSNSVASPSFIIHSPFKTNKKSLTNVNYDVNENNNNENDDNKNENDDNNNKNNMKIIDEQNEQNENDGNITVIVE